VTGFQPSRSPILYAAILSIFCASTLIGPAWAQSSTLTNVDLELVLAIDTSTSVDEVEFDLQRRGLASAFRHPNVHTAIVAAGSKGIAVAVLQWAGKDSRAVQSDWTHIRSPADAAAFADTLANAPRYVRGFTDIPGAIFQATHMLEQNKFNGARRTIDVSGDGTSSSNSPEIARTKAVDLGIIINGLVIYSDEYDLGILADDELLAHYRNEVIGGPGSFVMEAADFVDFQRAIRAKLIREIAGSMVALGK
jgi:hypothetical protein